MNTNSVNTFSESIKCGDIIRLQHVTTNKNLHSHYFSSPLSGYQEISCYGNNGKCRHHLYQMYVLRRHFNKIIHHLQEKAILEITGKSSVKMNIGIETRL